MTKLLAAHPPMKSHLCGNMPAKSVAPDPNLDDSTDSMDQSDLSSPEKSAAPAVVQSGLDSFYDTMYRCIYDGLQAYEKKVFSSKFERFKRATVKLL